MTVSRAAFLLLLLAQPALAQEVYTGAVEKVIDGDTLAVDVPGWPKPFRPAHIRIYGIDTPEVRKGRSGVKCSGDKGKRVKEIVQDLLPEGSIIQMQLMNAKGKREKYGRPIMRVFLPDGRNLGRKLLKDRLALPYDGRRKTQWCTERLPR